jgi:hypothetical protein
VSPLRPEPAFDVVVVGGHGSATHEARTLGAARLIARGLRRQGDSSTIAIAVHGGRVLETWQKLPGRHTGQPVWRKSVHETPGPHR